MAAKLKDIRQKLRVRRHDPLRDTGKWLAAVVRGYFQYHAIPDNEERLRTFRNDVQRAWLCQIRRRGQRHRWTWERFQERLGVFLPPVQILHPWPRARLAATTQGKNRVR